MGLLKNKITSITKQVPKAVTLPDGVYKGIWGGYVIEVEFEKEKYDLATEEGVRGIGINVVVSIIDGVATFQLINN